MNQNTKFLNFGESIPVQMRIETAIPKPVNWSSHVELYYVLDGLLEITVLKQKYVLEQDQLIIINPFESYAISNSGSRLAVFTIDLLLFDQRILPLGARFNCNSLTISNQNDLTPLKNILANFVKNNIGGCEGKELMNKSLSYALIHLLVSNFASESDTPLNSYSANIARMQNILQYLDEHYTENLKLSDLAERYFLSVPYMSKFFKAMIGTTFTEYMNDIRISHALDDLLRNNTNTELLAERHGFPNTRSLVNAFRQKYHMTPSRYKKYVQAKELPNRNFDTPSDFTDTIHTNHLGILSQYLTNDILLNTTTTVRRHILDVAPINVLHTKGPFLHNYKKTAALGKAKEILLSKNQEILKKIQNEIKFEYLSFHGLLDDDMMLYSEDSFGTPELSFSLIDATFDFLQSIKLKPVLELSFMPKALAKDNPATSYYAQSIISLPYDIEKWNYMIRCLINHLMDRYGDSEVATWPIYLWSTPDLHTSHLGGDGLDDYNALYYATWQTIKACNPNLIMGSPNFSNHSLETGDYLASFIAFCTEHDCMPDFLCMNFFATSNLQKITDTTKTDTNLVLHSSPDAFSETLDKVKENFEKLGVSHLPFYICEWNSSISHRELLHDTAFKSSYVVKNILENHNRFQSLAYWTLSDLLGEVKLSGQQFHGGLGMFTFDGTPKAVYHAYELLSQLGDTLIDSGDGYFLTQNANELQLMLYNYHHFSALYAAGELFDVTPTNRYTPFDRTYTQKFIIPLRNLADGNYVLTETVVNKEYGSSYDKWVELGAETLTNAKEQQYLRSASVPKIIRKSVHVESHQLIISRELEPHEIRLIKIRKKYSNI